MGVFSLGACCYFLSYLAQYDIVFTPYVQGKPECVQLGFDP